MEVRRATADDAGTIGRGLASVADEGRWLATPAGTPAGELADRFTAAIEEGHALFAVAEDGQVVGCLGLHPAGADGVLALGMWLLPPARGRGGGRALIRAALEHAQTTGAHKIELEVFPDNGRAISLYSSFGFEIEGVRRNHYRRPDGSLRSAVIMSLLL
ncbi:MAG: GNAT family N-acetyltransferase [Thermoleophilaceae bacterium]